MIAIVDTGGANISSIQNALLRLGAESKVSANLEELRQASHLILPGVGHAKYAMDRLNSFGLGDFLRTTQKPVLGICLGMQLLFSYLEEGNTPGLDILPGTVSTLTPSEDFRVPHMGWSKITATKKASLLDGIAPEESFYFVHSFQAPKGEYVSAITQSPQKIPAVVEYKNYYATQFHPEKSGTAGAKILEKFLTFKESSYDSLPRN
jgi:imidazole glycerol-phosphate synthase subunit HisH